jgi:hypothetical protein
MMHHDSAIPGGVHVQLDTIGVEHDRPAKGGTGVLVFVSGGAPVGDDFRASHGLR